MKNKIMFLNWWWRRGRAAVRRSRGVPTQPKSGRFQIVALLAFATLFQAGTAFAAETNAVCRAGCCREVPSTNFTDKSVYLTESKWTTDAGKEIRLGGLAGKPQVVLMFFSHCTVACPLLVNDLRRIEATLTPAERARAGFTLVSFDSERDTPAALAQYRKDWNLPGNWTLLNGKSDDVLELAALLGIRYRQGADGQFAHSNVITLLDASGEIVFQQTGLNADPQEMARRMEQLLK